MAYIAKHRDGWRVQIDRRGVRKSRVFATKSAAQAWAVREERAIIDGEVVAPRWPKKTVGEAFDRYSVEISEKKKSGDAEIKRFNAIRRHFPELSRKLLTEVTTADLAAWRDARLQSVTPGSVQRDINLLRHVWTVSRDEWGWHDCNPWKGLRMPGQNPPRTRLIGWREIRRLCRRCGYTTGVYPSTGLQCVAYAFLIALRTAMRSGEVLSLRGDTVELQRRVATLPTHKTVRLVGRREVPLTPQAVRLLRVLWRDGPLLPLPARTMDALFRKARDSALLEGFTFHDSRATALTHLARRVDVLTLARISGHKDVSLLLSTYYRETAEQIAGRLAGRPNA